MPPPVPRTGAACTCGCSGCERRATLQQLAEQAGRDLETACRPGRPALGGRHLRRRVRHRLLDGRRPAGPPGLLRRLRRRRALPRHRLPLRRDDRHPRRGRAGLRRQRPHGAAAADRDAAGRRSTGRGCTSATPTPAARMRKVEPLGPRASSRTPPGLRHPPRRGDHPRATSASSSGTPSARWSRSTRSRPGRRQRRRRVRRRARRAGQPAGLRRLPVDRLRAVHPPGRAGQDPRAAAGQRQTSAACTSSDDATLRAGCRRLGRAVRSVPVRPL